MADKKSPSTEDILTQLRELTGSTGKAAKRGRLHTFYISMLVGVAIGICAGQMYQNYFIFPELIQNARTKAVEDYKAMQPIREIAAEAEQRHEDFSKRRELINSFTQKNACAVTVCANAQLGQRGIESILQTCNSPMCFGKKEE